ncbi:MAG: hypothetical protein P8Q36_14340 [Alphaproteobacteria bacterium]|jgi:hypothetical protein|nr:hypothetical protein [Alphaproteobacteria bacterium]
MATETAGSADSALERMAQADATVTVLSDDQRLNWAGNMRDLAADWAFEVDIRDMPGRSMLTIWMAELERHCGPPLRAWNAPVLDE